MPEKIDLVLSGSGTLAPCHIGAYAYLVREAGMVVERVSGTSGGAIVAAGIAHNMTISQMSALAAETLSSNVLDPIPWWRPWEFLNGYGVHRFAKAHAIITNSLPGQLDQAFLEWGVWAVDLEVRQPVWIHSKRDSHIRTADAVLASASIPVFAQARDIRGMKGLFVDGGAAVNFGMDVWDDMPERRTIGIRFKGRDGGRRPVGNVVQFAYAVAQTFMNAANHTHISRKRYQDVIQVESQANGLDFNQTQEQVDQMFNEGFQAAKRWHQSASSDP